jgi:hypothetical protein
MRRSFVGLALPVLLAGCAPQIVVQPFSFALPLPVCEGRFDVVNQSSQTVRRFLARQGPGAPESDRLGAATLPPGSFVAVTTAPGPNDLRAVLADGRQLEIRRLDTCTVDAIIVTDEGLRPR